MSVEYKYRRYQDGDADAINHLYAVITGSTRSLQQYKWQWLDAPGGKGDIWLIEAVGDNGVAKLIGHHGIMPIRFSRENENLLFGKTENTMLLPEYRSKILYPRYERQFALSYEERFDALFSTFGHAAAIRQRRAMGYAFPSRWVHLRMPTDWTGNLLFVYRMFLGRLGAQKDNNLEPISRSQQDLSAISGTAPLRLRALNDTQARTDPFFDSFWPNCRAEYGLTPRRDRKDLDWRFWSNPNTSYITLVSDYASSEYGYVVMKFSSSSSDTAVIEDIVPSAPSAKSFGRLLNSALKWMRSDGFRWAEFTTTSDSCADGGIADGLTRQHLLLLQAIAKFRPQPDKYMPRKVTTQGKNKNIDVEDWYVTPIIFEGR